jgi:hypothetical protein
MKTHIWRQTPVAVVLGLAVASVAALVALWASGSDRVTAAVPTPNITLAYPAGTDVNVGDNFVVNLSFDSGAGFNITGGTWEISIPAGVSFVSAANLDLATFGNSIGFPGTPHTGPRLIPGGSYRPLGQADAVYTPSHGVAALTLTCTTGGTKNIDIEDVNEDPGVYDWGSELLQAGCGIGVYDAVSNPGGTHYTPDGTVQVTCVVPPPAVGGIAELPGRPGAFPEEAGAPSEGAGWSAGSYAALAGGVVAAAVAIVGGAWYARRRWLR